MSFAINALTRSLNVFHLAGSACNNCDIEILDALTPKYDLERFGITLVGSIRHADVLLMSGVFNKKARIRVMELLAPARGSCVKTKSYPPQRDVADSHHLNGEDACIDGAGLADRHGSYRNARGHLHGGKQRIHPVERPAFDGDADDGKNGVSSQYAA